MLDENGHVPEPPLASALIEHAAVAAELSRATVRLAADFAQSPHSTQRVGVEIQARLITAASYASSGLHRFAQTGRTAAQTPSSAWASVTGRMVVDHATARHDLRRAAETLEEAEKKLREHLALHRFFGPSAQPDAAVPVIAPTTTTDPAGHYNVGRALLDLTDQLNGGTSYEEAAALAEQILEPSEGLLERLADFFEAAGEKAKEADHDDGFDLAGDLEEAAVGVRALGEDLHLATHRMRALAAPGPVEEQSHTTPGRTAANLPPAPAPATPAGPRRSH